MKLNYALMLVMWLVIGAGCKNESKKTNENSSVNPSSLLSGDNQKTWHASKETDAQGDKEKLDGEEKKEYITFFQNGNVTMGGSGETRQGTWKYEGSTLVIQYEGEGVSENFTVLELDNNTLRIRAADGSEMTLKPE